MTPDACISRLGAGGGLGKQRSVAPRLGRGLGARDMVMSATRMVSSAITSLHNYSAILAELNPPGVEDQELLLRFYASRLQAICSELKLPLSVKGTAVSYLRRAYVHQSVLDRDPQSIFLTCLYLACKVGRRGFGRTHVQETIQVVLQHPTSPLLLGQLTYLSPHLPRMQMEESYISAAELARLCGIKASAILNSELPVLQTLRFDLAVSSPYRALAGFLEEARVRAQRPGAVEPSLVGLQESTAQSAHRAALAAVDALMLTDAPLRFSPGQLALAALRSGFNKVRFGP